MAAVKWRIQGMDGRWHSGGKVCLLLGLLLCSGMSQARADCPAVLPPASADCPDVVLQLPVDFEYSNNNGGLVNSGEGIGTGFLFQTPPDFFSAFNMAVDLQQGLFSFQAPAAPGLGALGIGVPPPATVVVVTTQVIITKGADMLEGGLWFGYDINNCVSLGVMPNDRNSVKVMVRFYVDGKRTFMKASTVKIPGKKATLDLRLSMNPRTTKADAWYGFNQKMVRLIRDQATAPVYYSFDQAFIDLRIGTATFAGLYSFVHVGDVGKVSFLNFGARNVPFKDRPKNIPAGVAFTRQDRLLQWKPTASVWGPDNALWLTSYTGELHRVSFDGAGNFIDDQVFKILPGKLTLGLAFDPSSTASKMVLWASYSTGTGQKNNFGVANSGTIVRLSGSGFSTSQTYIQGLPRSADNHGLYGIHFGPDKRLYFTIGGNTGSGAVTFYAQGLAPRPEQPLSAAVLSADVLNKRWKLRTHGMCATTENDRTGVAATKIPNNCAVRVEATGTRSMYSFVHHSNGQMYGADNGEGLPAVVPTKITPPCQGIVKYTKKLDPGVEPDSLYRIVKGKFYGHPNPSRGQCVRNDGKFQKAPKPKAFNPPMLKMGVHMSPNVVVEYKAKSFCRQLKGALIFTQYGPGAGNLRILWLSKDGTKVARDGILATDFLNPLSLTVSPQGWLVVGSFRQSRRNPAGMLSILVPKETAGGC